MEEMIASTIIGTCFFICFLGNIISWLSIGRIEELEKEVKRLKKRLRK